MGPSVLEPLGRAWERTLALLFRPLDPSKWLTLALAAFLISLGDCSGGGGGGGNFGVNLKDHRSPVHAVERAVRDAGNWAGEHLGLLLVLGTLGALVALCVWLLFVWLSSRGRFLLLDGVVRDRAAVVEPWGEYRREADSLFAFNILFQGVTIVLFLGGMALGLALAWSDLRSERFGPGALLALVLGGGFLFALSLAAALVALFLNDFVVPAMYARRLRVGAAWRAVVDEVLRPHLAAIVLYVLARIVVGLVLGLLALGLMCGTLGLACCLLMIPYVSSLVLLPFTVFVRTYSLEFLAQLGPAWTLRTPERAAS